jgi:hypothetical protein
MQLIVGTELQETGDKPEEQKFIPKHQQNLSESRIKDFKTASLYTNQISRSPCNELM